MAQCLSSHVSASRYFLSGSGFLLFQPIQPPMAVPLYRAGFEVPTILEATSAQSRAIGRWSFSLFLAPFPNRFPVQVDVAKAMDRLVERVLKAQTQLVADLKDVAGLVSGQVTSLEERAKSQSDAMVATFTGQTEAMVKAFTESMQTLQRTTGDTLADNVSNVTAHVAAIDRGLNSLNGILEAVGEKQVRVELKPRSVWQRLLGRS